MVQKHSITLSATVTYLANVESKAPDAARGEQILTPRNLLKHVASWHGKALQRPLPAAAHLLGHSLHEIL